jgi:hypothetical protein
MKIEQPAGSDHGSYPPGQVVAMPMQEHTEGMVGDPGVYRDCPSAHNGNRRSIVMTTLWQPRHSSAMRTHWFWRGRVHLANGSPRVVRATVAHRYIPSSLVARVAGYVCVIRGCTASFLACNGT